MDLDLLVSDWDLLVVVLDLQVLVSDLDKLVTQTFFSITKITLLIFSEFFSRMNQNKREIIFQLKVSDDLMGG